MPSSTFDLFLGCGLPLSDCYGQSEVCGPLTWDPIDVVRGTSGKALPGIEIRLADDGEILARGPSIVNGYLDDPAATAEAFGSDGWFRTGDLGALDDGGNLTIRGRKKELIIPSSAHNVSPLPIEAALKESPLVGQACAVGDGRPFIGALVVLDQALSLAWARQHDIGACTPAELAGHPALRAEISRHIAAINVRFARSEQVRAFAVLSDEWLPDSEELTATSKMRRANIHRRYAADIDRAYAEALTPTTQEEH